MPARIPALTFSVHPFLTWLSPLLPRIINYRYGLYPKVFLADFADALAVFIHEHTHIFGHDGSRSFLDALTNLLAEVVRFRHMMDTYEAEWLLTREQIILERQHELPGSDEDEIQIWLENLDSEALRYMMRNLPVALLNKLREKPIPPKIAAVNMPRPALPVTRRVRAPSPYIPPPLSQREPVYTPIAISPPEEEPALLDDDAI